MDTNLTEIAFILDRSGSMTPLAEYAIAAFNGFLREQQEAEGAARLTLVLFDNEYLKPVDAVPIEEVVPLEWNDYVPRGSTALLDAVGTTIDALGSKLAAMTEEQRPGAVVVAIFTDGLENASRKYSVQDVSQRIRHQTEVYKWTFLFLGANQNSMETAAKLNIARKDTSNYSPDGVGIRSSSRALSSKIRAIRKAASGMATPKDLQKIEEDLSDQVDREDKKMRE